MLFIMITIIRPYFSVKSTPDKVKFTTINISGGLDKKEEKISYSALNRAKKILQNKYINIKSRIELTSFHKINLRLCHH